MPQLVLPLETGTFQDSASKLFNSLLPNDIKPRDKLETNAKHLREKILNHLLKLRPNPD